MNRGPTLLGKGPIVSFLAIADAAFLLKREVKEADPIFELLERGVIRIELSLQTERSDLRALMHRYRSLPMSLADA